jgi:hypothetical protein
MPRSPLAVGLGSVGATTMEGTEVADRASNVDQGRRYAPASAPCPRFAARRRRLSPLLSEVSQFVRLSRLAGRARQDAMPRVVDSSAPPTHGFDPPRQTGDDVWRDDLGGVVR